MPLFNYGKHKSTKQKDDTTTKYILELWITLLCDKLWYYEKKWNYAEIYDTIVN